MISTIFGKTKPINYIIVLSFLFVLYWVVHFLRFDMGYPPIELLAQSLILGVLLFSIFIIDFVIKRNKLNDTNSFAMLFYALLIMVFSETLIDYNVIFCSLFLLLAMRRIVSLRSLKNTKLKIFDATMLIIVASLFYQWAVLYLILIFVSIYIYEPKNSKNWLVPLAAVFTVFMIAYSVLILADNTSFLTEHYQFSFEKNLFYFLDHAINFKLVAYIILTIVAGIFTFIRLGKVGLGKIATVRLIAFYFLIGLVLNVLTSSEGVYPIMVLFFPTVVFMTSFVEAIKKPNIKEIVLMTAIVVPFLVFVVTMVKN